jgi:GGDEF domain-containing protein
MDYFRSHPVWGTSFSRLTVICGVVVSLWSSNAVANSLMAAAEYGLSGLSAAALGFGLACLCLNVVHWLRSRNLGVLLLCLFACAQLVWIVSPRQFSVHHALLAVAALMTVLFTRQQLPRLATSQRVEQVIYGVVGLLCLSALSALVFSATLARWITVLPSVATVLICFFLLLRHRPFLQLPPFLLLAGMACWILVLLVYCVDIVFPLGPSNLSFASVGIAVELFLITLAFMPLPQQQGKVAASRPTLVSDAELTGLSTPSNNVILDRNAWESDQGSLKRQRNVGDILLCVIELDRLNELQDRFGPERSEQALAAFADELGTTIRKMDKVYNLGSGEFVLVLENSAANVFRERLEAVIRKVKANGYTELSVNYGFCAMSEVGWVLELALKQAESFKLAMKRGR